MTLQKIDDRRLAAAELDEAEERARNVNLIPEVQAARAKSEAADKEARRLNAEFSRIFNKYTNRGHAARLAKKYPGVLVLGDIEDEFKWVARCAVTRLPIYVGDRVFINGDEDYNKSYILADAVTVADGYDAEPVIVGADGEALTE
jgi:hypothetical protein